ncbi:MAG: outer membrane beta-barrel protein [Muribaculaceae bacterium]|nr:outer membrane beta-barrel protein [Muribaculaceae bacterium]
MRAYRPLAILIAASACLGAASSAPDTTGVGYETLELHEIVVKARQHYFKIKGPNKFVYEVYKDSTLVGANTMDALSHVPIMAVTKTGGVSAINGKPLVFKINGLNDPLLKSLDQALTALPADAVKTIEFKEDFSGSGQAILEVNIVTKGRLEGCRVQLTSNITDSRWSNSIWALSKVKRVTFEGGYTNRWMWGHESTSGSEELRYDTPDTYRFDTKAKDYGYKTDLNDFYATASYDVDDRSFINVFGRALFKANPRLDGWQRTDIYDEEGNLSASYDNDNHSTMKDAEYSLSVKYERDLTSDGRYGNLNIGYEFYSRPVNDNTTSTYNVNENRLGDGLEFLGLMDSRHRTKKGYATHTLVGEWTKVTSPSWQWRVYGKFRTRDESYENDINMSPVIGNTAPYSEAYKTMLMEYWGNIAPQFTYVHNNRWELRGGATVQAYHHSIRATGQAENTNKRISVLPFASTAIATNKSMILRLEYTMNEYIPDISALDPYVVRTDAGQISYGNPKLKPQIAHNLSFGLNGRTGKLYSGGTVNAYYQKDVSLRYGFVNDGIMNYTYGNIANSRGVSLAGYSSGRVHRNTYLRFNASVDWVQYRAPLLGQANCGWSFNCRAYAEQELPWDVTLSAEARYFSPSIFLQGRGGHAFSYDVNLYKQFCKRKLTVIIDADSFAPIWYRQKSSSFGPSFSSKSWSRTFHASFSLTLRYVFGNLRANVKSGSASMDNSDIKQSYDK